MNFNAVYIKRSDSASEEEEIENPFEHEIFYNEEQQPQEEDEDSNQPAEKKRRISRGRQVYSNQDLADAFEAIRRGMSFRQASKKHGIPRTTLFAKMKEGIPEKKTLGGKSKISQDETQICLDWIKDSTKRGFPVYSNQIAEIMKEFLEKNPREHRFTDNKPRYHFLKTFREKNKNIISCEKPKALTLFEGDDFLPNWLYINSYVEEKGLLQVMNDPSRVANMDEIFFEFSPLKDNQTLITHRRGEGVSCLYTILADGTQLNPFLIFHESNMPSKAEKEMPENVHYTFNAKGELTSEDFQYYIEFVFYKQLKDSNTEFPVVLFLDNQSTVFTHEIVKFCEKLQIHLICPCPGSFETIQPLTAMVLRPLKDLWVTFLEGKNLSINNVASHLMDFIKNVAKVSEFIKLGFKICAFHPWNAENINDSLIKKGVLNERFVGRKNSKDHWYIDEQEPAPVKPFIKEYEDFCLLQEENTSNGDQIESHKCDCQKDCTAFEEMKEIYGPEMYKKYSDRNFKPQTKEEKVLRRLILSFMPKKMLVSMLSND